MAASASAFVSGAAVARDASAVATALARTAVVTFDFVDMLRFLPVWLEQRALGRACFNSRWRCDRLHPLAHDFVIARGTVTKLLETKQRRWPAVRLIGLRPLIKRAAGTRAGRSSTEARGGSHYRR